MSTAQPIEQWTLEDFLQDLKQDIHNRHYYEIAPEYAQLFMNRIKERLETLQSQAKVDSAKLAETMAIIQSHRACCGSEHNPQIGKLHGYCVVCGMPWPCETARYFLRQKS